MRTLLVLLAASSISAASPKKGIRWIEDDYPKALAQARAAKVPLVVDTWAGWCHTCISMQSFVFGDPSLQAMASRFVWLEVDSDKPVNAAFYAKFPVAGLPTYLVIDPTDETISGRWVGSGSVPEMRTFLADGEKATQLAKKLPPGDPLALLRDGDRAEQAGKPAAAAELYAKAIAAAPADWTHRGQALGEEVMALAEVKAWDRCVQTAIDAIGDDHSVGPLTAAQVAYGSCAGELPDGDAKTKAVSTLEAWMWKAATDPGAPLSADDRGDVLGDVREGRDARGDEAGAAEAAKKQLEILDAAAAAAPDALAASAFNAARAKALLQLGRGAEAATMLEKSEKALPGVADPPMRLARVYAQLGRTADATAALDRAIPLASAKIRVSLQSMKSDLLEKDGKHAEACKALSAAISTLKELPDAQRDADTKAGLEKKLAACPATSR